MNVPPPAAEYRLYLSWQMKLLIVVPGIVLLAVSIGFFVASAWGVGQNAPPWFIGFLPLFGLLIFFLQVALHPYRIVWREMGTVDFVSWARTRSIRPEDFVSIIPDSMQLAQLRIKHRGGSFRLLPQFDGFHEFLTRLKAANPSIELRGC